MQFLLIFAKMLANRTMINWSNLVITTYRVKCKKNWTGDDFSTGYTASSTILLLTQVIVLFY